MKRRLTAILAADVVGYSRLMAADEVGTLDRVHALLGELVRPLVEGHGGRIFKLMGDGVLAEFGSVVDAAQCAIAIQRGTVEREADIVDECRLRLRIGINLGDVIVGDSGDMHGDGINVAARLESLADPGGVLISRSVRDQIRDKVDYELEDLGEQQVKNIPRPVRVFRILMSTSKRNRSPEMVPSAPPDWRRWPSMGAALALVAVMVTGFGLLSVFWVTPSERPTAERMATKLPDKPSIAVLPFADFSEGEDQEYFADGLTEEIISKLASFESIFVIARNSTEIFKHQPADVRTVAEDLGVRYILEGSIRRADNELRVTVQLIDALSGRHIWAAKYDREMRDIFAIQDEITAEIGARLVSKMSASEFERTTRRSTVNLLAYEAFLRGWAEIQRLSPVTNSSAIRMFELAIEYDQAFARAYAYLALTRGFNAEFEWANGPNDTLAYSLETALKAVELDPGDALTNRVVGHLYRMMGDYQRAIEALERAIPLAPNDAATLSGIAYPLAFESRGEEAVSYAEASMRLNPHAPFFYFDHAGIAYYANGQYADAARAFERAQELNPRFYGNLHWLAASYAKLGEHDLARSARSKFMEKNPHFSIAGYLERERPKGFFKKSLAEGLSLAGFPS